jgi:hypothetical protein
MRRLLLAVLVMLTATVAMAADPGDAQQTEDEIQAELDRRCEDARELKLAPIREDIYAECLEKKQGDEAFCQRQADGYNGKRIGGSPRFYELPECQAAFKHRNRRRN